MSDHYRADPALPELDWVRDYARRVVDFRSREERLDYWGWIIAVAVFVGTVTGFYVVWRMMTEDFLVVGGFTRFRDLVIDTRLWSAIGFVVLAAAATTRRLHDVGRRGIAALAPAGLALWATWLFGELFKSLPDPSGEVGDRIITSAEDAAEGNLTDSPLDILRDGFPRSPRVWDADTGDLLLAFGVAFAAFLTALPVLIALLRKGDPESNTFGPPPTTASD